MLRKQTDTMELLGGVIVRILQPSRVLSMRSFIALTSILLIVINYSKAV